MLISLYHRKYHLVSYYSVSISCFGNRFSLFGMFWVDIFLFGTVFQVHMGMGQNPGTVP